MYSSYLKVILRNLRKQPLYSFINIFGLAIGMTSSILILLWVQKELSYDSFNKNAENIYRVVENQHYAGRKLFPVAVTPAPLAKSLKDSYPEIINSARFDYSKRTLRYNDKVFAQEMAFADPAFLKIFTYPLESGNIEDVLNDPNSIIMTREAAAKYFGNVDPIGKSLVINDTLNLKVTGILKKVPENSHLKFTALVPFEFQKTLGRNIEQWENNSYYTYVQLQAGTSATEIDKKIKDEIKRHNEGSVTDIYLQPLLKIHLYSAGKYTADISGHGSIEYVNIFSLVALIVLFIACINFMNLSTARASKRAKEVGLRKVIGANKWQLIKQFYFESFLFAFLALLIAVGISSLLFDLFSNLVGKEISFSSLDITIIIGFILLTILTGIVAGSYPSIYLSSFLPVKVLKSNSVATAGGSLFRKILVVTQFSLSLILIIGTIIISKQLNYINSKDIGFDRENVVSFKINESISSKIETVKNELKQNQKIISVAGSMNPTYVTNSSTGLTWKGKNENDKILFHFMFTDQDFASTFDMKIVEGRFFSKEHLSDTSSIVLNEEAAKVIGMEDPVGKSLTMWSNKLTIIGIIKDFNFKPLKTKIEPIVLLNAPSFSRTMFARIKPEDIPVTISYIENTYKKFSPSEPFNYHFLDEDFNNLYKSETRMQIIFSYFAILAIIISSLGLFGLASYITEIRTKEIGIRKVLGANIFNITYLLSLDFTKWVLISIIIAWPLSYYIMNKWLLSFAYKIEISLWIFPLSGILLLLFALITVSYQTIKAARMNPVQSLKYE